MKPGRYAALVRQSLRRHRGHFFLSSLGIVIGVATLIFFTSLGTGVQRTVLEEVFVIGQIEVVDPADGVGSLFGSGPSGLGDREIRQLEAIPGVAAAFPKMKLTFPSSARGGGALLGRDIAVEFIADGIPPELLDSVPDLLGFDDFGASKSCAAHSQCFQGQECREGKCEFKACSAEEEGICTGESYCHEQRQECALPIPIIVSPGLLEVYNGSVHRALRGSQGMGGRLPRLTEEMLVGFEFDILFGQSYMGRTPGESPHRERARLVGFSERAMQIGATMPIGYVIRYNERFTGEEAGETYHSILVEASSNDQVAPITRIIRDDLGLELADRHQQAERAGLLIFLLTLLFNLIALIILAIAALNITHTFSMMVVRRRSEIGLMRALGARRSEIRALLFGEATMVGLFAGVMGLLLALGVMTLSDGLFHRYVGDFSFKPESLYVLEFWMVGLAFGVSLFFSWIGALLPAFRAARIEPSEALSN